MAESGRTATPAALSPAGRVLNEAAVLHGPGQAALEGPGGKALGGAAGAAQACVVTPDTSVFDASWFGPAKVSADASVLLPRFRELLDEHNGRFADLLLLQQAVLAAAQTELLGSSPTNILRTIIDLYDDAVPTPGRYVPQGLFDRLVASVGGPRVFDPWDNWWCGEFWSGRTRYFPLHIWDPTVYIREAGFDQFVQPVTQVDGKGEWFGSARRFAEEPKTADVTDHAINVWSPEHAGVISGYVRKKGESLPHLGFLIEPNVLVWFAIVERDKPQGVRSPVDHGGAVLLMFLEATFRGTADPDTYLIRGAVGQVTRTVAAPSGGELRIGALSQANEHRGSYREMMHLRDRGALRCAINTAALVRMERSFAERVYRETAP